MHEIVWKSDAPTNIFTRIQTRLYRICKGLLGVCKSLQGVCKSLHWVYEGYARVVCSSAVGVSFNDQCSVNSGAWQLGIRIKIIGMSMCCIGTSHGAGVARSQWLRRATRASPRPLGRIGMSM